MSATLAPLPALRLLVLARQPAAAPAGFGPYMRCGRGQQGLWVVSAARAALLSCPSETWSQPSVMCCLPSHAVLPAALLLPCSACSGAAWDATSVAALMQLARTLPHLTVQLERVAPPGLPPCTCGHEDGLDPAALLS